MTYFWQDAVNVLISNIIMGLTRQRYSRGKQIGRSNNAKISLGAKQQHKPDSHNILRLPIPGGCEKKQFFKIPMGYQKP